MKLYIETTEEEKDKLVKWNPEIDCLEVDSDTILKSIIDNDDFCNGGGIKFIKNILNNQDFELQLETAIEALRLSMSTMDCEDYEKSLLKGALQLLKRFRQC
jgi:hypothetical protein